MVVAAVVGDYANAMARGLGANVPTARYNTPTETRLIAQR